MSCRVLGRGVEALVLAELARRAREAGAAWRLEGVYIPTERNGMVADLYPRHGLPRSGAGGGGATRWAAAPAALSAAPASPIERLTAGKTPQSTRHEPVPRRRRPADRDLPHHLRRREHRCSSPEMTADDIAGLGLGHPHPLIFAIEDEFGIKLSMKDLESLDDVGALRAADRPPPRARRRLTGRPPAIARLPAHPECMPRQVKRLASHSGNSRGVTSATGVGRRGNGLSSRCRPAPPRRWRRAP